MRFSVLALCGAASVSALAVPSTGASSDAKRAAPKPIDLAQFGKFKTTTLEEAKTKLEAALKKIEDDVDSVFSKTTAATNIDWNTIKDHDKASYLGGALHPAANSVAKLAAAAGLHARQSGNSSTSSTSCTTPSVRVEWRDMSEQDRSGFVKAVRKLMDLPASGAFEAAGAKSRYDDLVSVHYQMTPDHPRRRPVPAVAPLLPPPLRGPAPVRGRPHRPPALVGRDPRCRPLLQGPHVHLGLPWLCPLANNGQGFCVEDGAFAGKVLTVGGTQCLARGVDESSTSNCNQNFINVCNSYPKFSDMANCAELGPHAYGHNGIGAVMMGVPTSPNDPSFFLHHAFVDHAYRIWQIADPNNRLTQINGCADKTNPCTPASGNVIVSSEGLRPDTTVGDLFDTTGGYLCYRYSY
ncbi:Di-copper centre-containing protein [Apiospora hydei]|uniref:Di-copper centre-containing protein n=1 Tax=Apiospora hydei TaxID=1337664 RepID=A0ABR1VHY8_9PEZI